MVHVAFCDQCRVIHKSTFLGKSITFFQMVAYHSERKKGHNVQLQDKPELTKTELDDGDLRHFPSGFVIGIIESDLIMTA